MDAELVEDIRRRGGKIALDDWRKVHPEPGPDDDFVPSPRIDLRHADLSGIIFSKADLSGADLSYATLHEAIFSETDLHNADLTGAEVDRARFLDAQMAHAALRFLKASDALFDGSCLDYADASQGRFDGASFAQISGKALKIPLSNCSRTTFFAAKLELADFRCTDLTGATFRDATVIDVNFGHAKISPDCFTAAVVRHCLTTRIGIKNALPDSFIHSRARGRLVPVKPNPFVKKRRF